MKKTMTIYDDAIGDMLDGEGQTYTLGGFCIKDEAIAFVQVSSRVTNLLYLIDELGLNQCEMSDLSAALYNRMDWLEIKPQVVPAAYDEDF
jgi:hypothetical protein